MHMATAGALQVRDRGHLTGPLCSVLYSIMGFCIGPGAISWYHLTSDPLQYFVTAVGGCCLRKFRQQTQFMVGFEAAQMLVQGESVSWLVYLPCEVGCA
jgi:hypothetical protein